MAVFRYSAVNSSGGKVRGKTEAYDENAAVDRLRRTGLTVIDIKRVEGGAGGTSMLHRLGFVRTADVVLFFRMFAALIGSHIPISEAMGILHEQFESRKFKWVLGEIKASIEGGDPLSTAMAAHPTVFDDLLTGMIRSAELGGMLDVVLERIAVMLENRAALKRKLIISMIYPGVVVVVSLGVVIFLVTFVIPKFSTLMGGRKLPANTQFLLDTSDFIVTHGLALGIGAGGLAALLVLCLTVPELRFWVDRYRMHIPVIGPVFRFGVVVQFAESLASLLKSGITLVDALRAGGDTVSNLAVRRHLVMVNDKVQAGEPLSAVLENDPFFPVMVRSMVKVGEHSGLMDEAFDTVARIFDKLLADKIARMSAMLEPALIIVLGGVVGYVAWGLVAGMLAMYTAGS
ncbi:type II secretion system F family protein [Desulfatiferula olefinivorans]